MVHHKIVAGLVLAAAIVGFAPAVHAATCTKTGFRLDGINLTAALIDPPTVSGEVDATGCNIGIFYSAGGAGGTVDKADIHGSNYFGVVNRGAVVTITNSHIHNIGEQPFNGAQHGVGYFCQAKPVNTSAGGSVSGNLFDQYQKAGITVLGRSCGSVSIDHNIVTGLGPVDFISQNGIEVGLGASGVQVVYNVVSANSYTGPNEASSGGILAYGGQCFGGPVLSDVRIQRNTIYSNDVGVYIVNYDSGCVVTSTVTQNSAVRNTIWNGAVFNTTGNGRGPYQVGIAEAGNEDQIVANSICGDGYAENTTRPNFIKPIDAQGTNVNISGNKCSETNTPVGATVGTMASASFNALHKASKRPSPFVP